MVCKAHSSDFPSTSLFTSSLYWSPATPSLPKCWSIPSAHGPLLSPRSAHQWSHVTQPALNAMLMTWHQGKMKFTSQTSPLNLRELYSPVYLRSLLGRLTGIQNGAKTQQSLFLQNHFSQLLPSQLSAPLSVLQWLRSLSRYTQPVLGLLQFSIITFLVRPFLTIAFEVESSLPSFSLPTPHLSFDFLHST